MKKKKLEKAKKSAAHGEKLLGNKKDSAPKGDCTKSISPNIGEVQAPNEKFLHTRKIQNLILL